MAFTITKPTNWTAIEITSRRNRNPANAETEPEGVTRPVSRPIR